MDVHRAGFDAGIGIVPHFGQQLLFGDDALLIAKKIDDDIHLPAGDLQHRFAANRPKVPAVKQDTESARFAPRPPVSRSGEAPPPPGP